VWRFPADFFGADDRLAVAEVVVTRTLAARKQGADFPILEQRMHEAFERLRAGLAIQDFAALGDLTICTMAHRIALVSSMSYRSRGESDSDKGGIKRTADCSRARGRVGDRGRRLGPG
jgi:hypothetical protein